MENVQETMQWANFKCYDNKGRRVALVCRTTKDSRIEIFKLTCSKKDPFTKRIGWETGLYYFDNGLEAFKLKYPHYHPEIYSIEFEAGKPRRDFNRWCANNLKRKREITLPCFIPLGTSMGDVKLLTGRTPHGVIHLLQYNTYTQ